MPEPITDPNQVDPSLPPSDGTITSPEQNTGVSSYDPYAPQLSNYAYSGPTGRGMQRAQGMIGQIDQRVAGYENKDAQNTANEIGAYRRSIEGEKAAVGGVQAVNTDYESKLKDIDTKKQALFDEAARQEQDARAEAKASAMEFTSKYTQQLAAVRAMSVNIAGPIAKLSTGEAGGLSLAMFAQGFLAAQGININVGQQIDRWVERSIHEQERQITQAESAANDQLNLWHIARQNSQDDLEARQRYRGYIIEGLKAQTEYQAARFQSRLANAQADVTKAHLDTEATMNSYNMAKDHEKRVFEEKKWQTQTAFEMARVNLERERVELERERNKAKAEKPQKHQIIIDPSDGKAKWVIGEDRINATDDAKVATKAQADYGRIDKEITEAIKFREKHAQDQWGHLPVMDRISEAKRQYEAMVERIAIEMGKTEFGTRASDKEAERIKKLVPFDKWYQEGDNTKIWTKYREDVRSDFDQTMRAHADAIPEAQQVVMPHNDANPSAKAIYQADTEGGPPIDRLAAKEQAQVVGKDSSDIDPTSYGSSMWRDFITDKKIIKLSGRNTPNGAKSEWNGVEYQPADNPEREIKMPGWAVAIDHLAEAWVNPDKFNSLAPNESVDKISKDAQLTLQKLASGKTDDGKKVPEPAIYYAKHILDMDVDGILTHLNDNPMGAIGNTSREPKFK